VKVCLCVSSCVYLSPFLFFCLHVCVIYLVCVFLATCVCTECLKLQVIFRKRATNYRALLRKTTYINIVLGVCLMGYVCLWECVSVFVKVCLCVSVSILCLHVCVMYLVCVWWAPCICKSVFLCLWQCVSACLCVSICLHLCFVFKRVYPVFGVCLMGCASLHRMP